MTTRASSGSPANLDPRETGQWELLPYDSQVEAVHMALLRTGKVLLFSGFRFPEAVECETRLWYPKTGEIKKAATPVNLICAGHSFLPDGRLFATGGTLEYRNPPAPPLIVRLTRPLAPLIIRLSGLLGSQIKLPVITGPTFSYLFNPATEAWEFSGDMEEGRWYPTNTTLPDGRVLILSGTNEGGGVGKTDPIQLNTRVEVFSVPDGIRQVAVLPEPAHPHASRYVAPVAQDAPPGGGHDFISLYPRMHVLPLSDAERETYPAGKLFCSGYGPETRFLNAATWEWTDVADLKIGIRNDGTAVLLPLRPPDYRAMVLTFGGIPDPASELATETAEIMDFGKTPYAWEYVEPMRHKRVNVCAVLLPDGQVLAVGGNSKGQFDDIVYDVEMFDPDERTWQTVAPMRVPRGYHSTALLLPDGRVLACGSTPYGNYELRMEVYSPPYLFKGPRPKITHVSQESIPYGEHFEVSYSFEGSIRSVALVRPGATTHAFDMDQRYVELTFDSQANDRLTVAAPRDEHLAPPGYYMLFLLSSEGVPSEAKFIHLPVRQKAKPPT